MVRIEPIEVFAHIEIDRSAPPKFDEDTQARVESAWHDLCAQSPRYFNGAILLYTGIDRTDGVIRARVGAYKHHALRGVIGHRRTLLAVTAVVRSDGLLLLGRRSGAGHDYPGLWELGPSGGVDVPQDRDTLDRDALHDEVLREVREEAGITRAATLSGPICIVHDSGAGSSDLVVEVGLDDRPTLETNWEYDETRWLTLDELLAWCEQRPDELIPTTVALARFLQGAGDRGRLR